MYECACKTIIIEHVIQIFLFLFEKYKKMYL